MLKSTSGRNGERRKIPEPGARTEEEISRAWLDKIEETLEKIRQEEESRKEARIIYEQRRNTLLAEKMQRQKRY